MKKLRYFTCPSKHTSEQLVEDSVLTFQCDKCGEVAKRMMSAPRHFGNTTGRSPSSSKR
jgi:transcription initiation factor IIE alpha subunit